MSSRNQQRGLTLIELLVVLAIIAILAGLLLPVSSGHRPNLLLRCMSNMRQVTAALAFYAQDHNFRFPDFDQSPGNTGPSALFLISTQNYIGTNNVFVCPVVVRQREKARHFYQKRFVPQINQVFFVSNGNDYSYYDGLSTGSGTNVILADRFAWTNRAGMPDNLRSHPTGIINVGFTDGHVEWIKPNVIIGTNLTPPWSKILDPIRVP